MHAHRHKHIDTSMHTHNSVCLPKSTAFKYSPSNKSFTYDDWCIYPYLQLGTSYHTCTPMRTHTQPLTPFSTVQQLGSFLKLRIMTCILPTGGWNLICWLSRPVNNFNSALPLFLIFLFHFTHLHHTYTWLHYVLETCKSLFIIKVNSLFFPLWFCSLLGFFISL